MKPGYRPRIVQPDGSLEAITTAEIEARFEAARARIRQRRQRVTDSDAWAQRGGSELHRINPMTPEEA